MSPRLTIVVPVYNRAELVVRTLDSIVASSARDYRLIVVDNGSTDDSLVRCQEWAALHQDVCAGIDVLEEPWKGAAIARNRGLAACQTEYVYFFDSDDLFDTSLVTAIDGVIDQEAQAGHEPLDMVCLPVRQEVNGRTRTRAYVPTSDAAIHIINSMLGTLSMVFRTNWLRKLGGWDERLGVWDDWELGLRALLARPRLRWITARPYHHIIVHSQSITGASFTQTLNGILRTMQAALDDVESVTVAENERERLRTAYYLRCLFFAGMLRREKNLEGEQAFRQLAEKCLPDASRALRWGGQFLCSYVGKGGRGGWWLALKMLRSGKCF